ncbi:DUF6290 family protein [Clostridium cibarium]|uniref:DUF1778 domain-containing protein n=1 Tax=Clostridium cibarium TaxID=2762247 RepID=A0ABR8PZB6_9CLOT|nr:DUF6290 family protein [Clostridium cibarium]MBD7913477.1 DUF1778 domain-containing protein [Clostridium cibarium]
MKDAEIKVRLTKEEKEFLRKIAKVKGLNMTEFILNTTLESAKKIEDNIKTQKIIKDRISSHEEKIMKLTEKIRGNKENKKRAFSFLKRNG